jgi:hypothetical protein
VLIEDTALKYDHADYPRLPEPLIQDKPEEKKIPGKDGVPRRVVLGEVFNSGGPRLRPTNLCCGIASQFIYSVMRD